MTFSAILGAWIAAFLTLGIFSYLYKILLKNHKCIKNLNTQT